MVKLFISSTLGIGDVNIKLVYGKTTYAKCKKRRITSVVNNIH